MEPIPKNITALSYEQTVEQLEAILESIESGESGLEEALKASQRATLLIRHCRAILEEAHTRVAELTRDASGQFMTDEAAQGLVELDDEAQ